MYTVDGERLILVLIRIMIGVLLVVMKTDDDDDDIVGGDKSMVLVLMRTMMNTYSILLMTKG